ncbi:12567_t:CDS:2, partial [Funneliformis geosporum]
RVKISSSEALRYTSNLIDYERPTEIRLWFWEPSSISFASFQTPVKTTAPQAFGAWQNPQAQQPPAFGFGQPAAPSAYPTPAQTPFGGFGQTQQQTPSFGGAGATPFGFGQQQQPQAGAFGFGQNQQYQQPAGPSGGVGFGFQPQAGPSNVQTSSAFGFGIPGPSNAPVQVTGTSSGPGINPRLTGTQEPKFEPYKDREPSGVYQIFQNITAMEAFRPWSPEELRLYDFELNRRPGVQQTSLVRPAQSLPPIINASTQAFQLPSQPTAQQPMGFAFGQSQLAQPPFSQQPFAQQPYGQSQFAQQPTGPQQFGQFGQQPVVQPQLPFQQNLQAPATTAIPNPYNYQYTGNLYYRLHGTNNPPPLVFETKLKPKVDKGKGKEFTLQPQQYDILGTSPSSVNVTIGNISKLSKADQLPTSTVQVPTIPFSVPSAVPATTIQIVSTSASVPILKTPTVADTKRPAIIITGSSLSSRIVPSIINKEKPKGGDSDDNSEYVDFFPEKKTRTTPLPPEEYERTLTEVDFPRRKRNEPIYNDGILTPKDIKEPTWGYKTTYRRTVPKIRHGSSGKDLLEQLKLKDRSVDISKSLTNTIETNKKKVPGADIPPENDVDARLVYELLLKPRRDGPYAYREEYDGTWTPLYGDGRDEKPKWEPMKWKQQVYYNDYVKDIKRTKLPITEERYEAPSWWDKHPYKPVPKELVKDIEQYDNSNEAFVEDMIVKMGLRPDPPKDQIDALSRQVIVKLVRIQKKPLEWTETITVTEPCTCCNVMVQKSKEEKKTFNKIFNPLIGGFESQPAYPNQPLVFVYAALPGEFEDRTPTYSELLNKYKAGIPQRNMFILDAPPRMPRVDFSNIIKGEMEFAKIVKEDVHKICHQDKKCDCPYTKKEPKTKETPAIPRSHFYCYERLGKKPRENKPTTFQTVHGYQPFSNNKTPESDENTPTKKHRILVPPQGEDDEL